MKKLMMVMMAGMAASAFAEAHDWELTSVNSRNRMPPRTYSMPLANEQAAFTDALEPATPYKQSLNGIWKISWAGNPDLRVREFWYEDFDDSQWLTIDVPSCVELRGFGSPGYTNTRYPHKLEWPKILDRQTGAADYNPVSSYRTKFTVPESWKGRDVILRFDGVYSAYYVWVNGREVGYAEDSKLPSEFDITPFLKPSGENTLAVEVYRWCDGSYLEDQDMTRYTGIFRDVTLWAKPKDGIWDFTVKTGVDGSLTVDCPGATWTLYDADGKKVDVPVKDVKLWSAEKPYLYTLVVRKGEDIRMRRVGFKDQRIEGCRFLVNGKPVKFKGVNRHETNPDNGRTVSLEDMIRDIELMKKYNINMVRTSHYPDHHLWYDLCDRYGIYLCAEANVEAHEPGYGEKGLGQFSVWESSIAERNERHAIFYRNHPSVTIWSLGNETGPGCCFESAAAKVRAADPTRPIHWERDNKMADLDSTMYPSVAWLKSRGEFGDGLSDGLINGQGGDKSDDHTKGKCFFLCEYAHSMGNALGDFEDYWQQFYAFDSLCGGCIWDWVDQAIWKSTDRVDPQTGTRERYLSYGGDFDEQPNDGPFNCNGVVDPLRRETAKLIEVGHVHRNLVVTRSTVGGGNGFATVFELWNRHLFTSADEFLGKWTLIEDGTPVAEGAFEPPALTPLSRCRFTVSGLAEALAKTQAGAELFVNFAFALKADMRWAKAGWVVARDQVRLSEPRAFAAPVSATAIGAVNDEKTVTVTAGSTKAVFCRQSGTLCELTMAGKTILKDPAPGIVSGPQFTCARAFTDNDRWMRGATPSSPRSFFTTGLTQLRYHARPLAVEGNQVKAVVEVTGSKSAGFTHTAVWTFGADGSISVQNTVEPHGTMPEALPRAGLSLKLDPSLSQVAYYGRGPRENYRDRCSASFLGRWESAVDDLGEFYVRPQDNGFRGDVRWVEFRDQQGKGVRFAASEPMYVQALRNTWEEIDFARHRAGQQRFRAPLVPRKEVCLNLDIRQTGLGGASCGPAPQEKNRFPIETWSWTLNFSPVK